MVLRLISFIMMAIFMPTWANAHIGHIGELAGHGHLIGLAALATSAAMAAWLAKRALTSEDDQDQDEQVSDEDDNCAEQGDTVHG